MRGGGQRGGGGGGAGGAISGRGERVASRCLQTATWWEAIPAPTRRRRAGAATQTRHGDKKKGKSAPPCTHITTRPRHPQRPYLPLRTTCLLLLQLQPQHPTSPSSLPAPPSLHSHILLYYRVAATPPSLTGVPTPGGCSALGACRTVSCTRWCRRSSWASPPSAVPPTRRRPIAVIERTGRRGTKAAHEKQGRMIPSEEARAMKQTQAERGGGRESNGVRVMDRAKTEHGKHGEHAVRLT